MEKKTIGGFIAALRKANGMTQRELAERLNVSDKTISRWERDDGTPDLATIPVLAEIFGVTCDELLRGERRSPEERSTEPAPSLSEKGQKQRQRLLKVSQTHYQNQTYLAFGLAIAGLLSALVANLAFTNALVGAFLGAAFCVASLLFQLTSVNKANLAVEDAELDGDTLAAYRHQVQQTAERAVGFTATCLGFTAPLALVDAYMGLGPDSLLLFGSLGAALFLALYGVLLHLRHGQMLRADTYPIPAAEKERFVFRHKLAGHCGSGLAAVLVVTLMIHALGTELFWSTSALAHGTTFQDYESFVAYMEQDIPDEQDPLFPQDDPWMEAPLDADGDPIPVEVPSISEGETWYDANGNPISKEEAYTRTLQDRNGEVVCTYVHRNRSVTSIRYSPKEGTVLPITTITSTEYRAASQRSQLITTLYTLLYPLEVLLAGGVYWKKRNG